MRARQLPLVLVIGVLLLAGCVPQPAEDPVEPAPSSAPLFASEEEALAAAVAAYEDYLKVSDAIAADGGANPERLKDLVTEEWYEKEVEVIESIQSGGLRQAGTTSSRNATLQRLDDRGLGVADVTIYVCADASATRFLNAQGTDVTPDTRNALITNEVLFSAQSRTKLVLVSSSPWQDASLC